MPKCSYTYLFSTETIIQNLFFNNNKIFEIYLNTHYMCNAKCVFRIMELYNFESKSKT